MKTQFCTMECALAGLFDYAGMFPPAELDLRTALDAYLDYRRSGQAWALGNLVIDMRSLNALLDAAEEQACDLPLSVLATGGDLETVRKHLDRGLRIEMIELRAGTCGELLRWKEMLPARVTAYVELPADSNHGELLNAIAQAGMRAKLRMGGVVAEAFPSTTSVAVTLKELALGHIPFKATAGLHHPLRARHPLTYQHDSPSGAMHGFMNLLCASALLWFGGEAEEALELLEEQDAQVWCVTSDAIRWRSLRWTADELREVRDRFLIRIGSCSFTEPIRDLEGLGWL